METANKFNEISLLTDVILKGIFNVKIAVSANNRELGHRLHSFTAKTHTDMLEFKIQNLNAALNMHHFNSTICTGT